MNINLPCFKIIVVGDYGVGKTSLVRRCVDESYCVQIGAPAINLQKDSLDTSILLDDGFEIDVSMWDTAGEECHGRVASSYYRNAHAVLFVYDTDSSSSLESVVRWLSIVNKDYSDIPVRFLVGTKSELEFSERTDAASSGVAERWQVDAHIRCSSVSGQGVRDVMRTLGEKLRLKAVEKALADAERQRNNPIPSAASVARITHTTCQC
jgi:small GTP-binding protein